MEALFWNSIPFVGWSSLCQLISCPVPNAGDGSLILSHVFDVNHSRIETVEGQSSSLFSICVPSKTSASSTGPSISMNFSYSSRLASISIHPFHISLDMFICVTRPSHIMCLGCAQHFRVFQIINRIVWLSIIGQRHGIGKGRLHVKRQ